MVTAFPNDVPQNGIGSNQSAVLRSPARTLCDFALKVFVLTLRRIGRALARVVLIQFTAGLHD